MLGRLERGQAGRSYVEPIARTGPAGGVRPATTAIELAVVDEVLDIFRRVGA
jgi:hypothetical protein